MNTARQRLSARDYKHGGRRPGGFDLLQYRQFGLGLALGLGVALLVWVRGQQMQPAEPTEPTPDVIVPEAEVAAADPPDPAEQFEFYNGLPTFEVVVPETDRNTRRDQSLAPITKPGSYILQVRSFRGRTEAERERDRLIKQGIDATIQRVIIDDMEWNRVIVGPSRDLDYVNATRAALREAQINVLIYESGE